MIKAIIFDFNGVIYTDDYDEKLLDFIDELHQSYKIGMITNYSAAGYERYIAPIKSKFDDIVVSSHVGLTKPDPEIYKLAAKRLGVQVDQCVYIDDHDFRVEGAKKVQMHGIIYNDFEQMKSELAAVTDN